jgi:hypothetical protein
MQGNNLVTESSTRIGQEDRLQFTIENALFLWHDDFCSMFKFLPSALVYCSVCNLIKVSKFDVGEMDVFLPPRCRLIAKVDLRENVSLRQRALVFP